MSGLRIKGEMPLCDKHRAPMKMVRILMRIGGDTFEREGFACSVGLCQRQYHIAFGYYSVSRGQFESGSGMRMPCPECEHSMELRETRGSVQKWVCPVFECRGVKRTASCAGVTKAAASTPSPDQAR